MKRYFLLLIIISISGFARQSKIDSLLTLLQKEKEDTAKINCLNDLSRELLNNGDYNPAMKYANDALILCDKLLSINRSEHSKSILNLKRAAAYNNIGIIYKNQSNFDKALENYFTALKIREEAGDKQGIAYSYNNIGIIYYEQNNYSKALENYFASLKIREEIGDKKGIAASYNNIGNIYAEQASLSGSDSATYQELYDKALQNYFSSLKIKEEIDDKNGMAYSYNNIGSIYYEQAELERNPENKEQLHAKASENYFTSMRIREAIGDKNGIAACYINIGTFYTSLKQFSKAKEYLIKGLLLSQEIGSKNYIKESYRGLSDLYSVQGNWKEAYQNHKLFSEVKDSILNEESSKQIAEMQTKYETEKKEQQITLLNKEGELQKSEVRRQKIIIWSVAAGLFVVLILSIFIFRERRKSEKLLLNILPAETAKELKANGKAKAKHYESVTVMFTDFKGFTNIAEKLSAEELVNELDFLFRKFDEIISKYNIEKIKTIGDAYMCASGLPTPNSNHAECIVKAAMEIQEWMTSPLHSSPSGEGKGERWQLRIGIHTGPVTAGVVGDKKFAYDIWGDTVNTASRMESSGEAGKINISGSTYELLKPHLNTQYPKLNTVSRGKIPAKNKGEIEMYFVEKPT